MENLLGSQAKNWFNKMVDELKTFKLSIFGKYIVMLAAIFMLLTGFGAKSFWMCLLNFAIGVFVFALEYLSCFVCFKELKPINEKLNPLRTPLYKGCIFLVGGILFWQSNYLASILGVVGGVLLILGNYMDKKDGGKAPMV